MSDNDNHSKNNDNENGDDGRPSRSPGRGNGRQARLERRRQESNNNSNGSSSDAQEKVTAEPPMVNTPNSNTQVSSNISQLDSQERMERKLAAFSSNNSKTSSNNDSSNNQSQRASQNSNQSATSRNSSTNTNAADDLRERAEQKMRANQSGRSNSNSDSNDRGASTDSSHNDNTMAPLRVPASRRPRRNQRGAASPHIPPSTPHSTGDSGGILLEMTGSMMDVTGDGDTLSGPVVSVGRGFDPSHVSAVEMSTISNNSTVVSGSASAPLSQTTRVIKERTTISTNNDSAGGPAPGAYQIQGRAIGAVPAWVRRVGNNMRRSISARGGIMARSPSDNDNVTDQSHLPPEMRTRNMMGEQAASSHTLPNAEFSLVPPPDNECPEPFSLGTVESQDAEKKKRQKFWIIIIAVAVFVIVGVGAGVGIAISGGGSSEVITEATIATTESTSSPAPTPCNTDYDNLSQAHQDCLCAQTPSLLETTNPAVTVIYNMLRIELELFAILTDRDLDTKPCSYENIALYWLAEDMVEKKSVETPTITLANRYLLAILFLSWTGSNRFLWDSYSGWMTSAPECTWFGVVCGSTGNVEQLLLSNNMLLPRGGMPKALFELTFLAHIDLSSNNLMVPSIPNAISKLQKLETLNLEANHVMGGLPFERFPKSLVTLKLQSTFLTPTFPTTIGLLSKLETLDLRSSKIGGHLPSELGSLTQLRKLDLSGNNTLISKLPSEMGLMTGLEIINMEANTEMRTDLFSEIGRLTNLVVLNLPGVQGFGALPTQLGLLTELTQLNLLGQVGHSLFDPMFNLDGFSSSIPSELGMLTNLVDLILASHHLTGQIPSEIGQLGALQRFDVAHNLLTGTVPKEISTMSSLRVFRLRGVFGGGDVPVARNEIMGTIPSGLGDLADLSCFDVTGTLLTGTVPEGICINNAEVYVNVRCVGIAKCVCCVCDGGDECHILKFH